MVTIVDGKKRIPYLRGMLVQYLFERGFSHDQAYELADAVRTALSKRQDVNKAEVVELIDRLIGERFGNRTVGDLVFWERPTTAIAVGRRQRHNPLPPRSVVPFPAVRRPYPGPSPRTGPQY